MTDRSTQRTKPLHLEELGIRLGMPERFSAISEAAAQGERDKVATELSYIRDELEALGRPVQLVADVLEVLGEFCSEDETPPVLEKCLKIRKSNLGPDHSDTVFVRHLLGSWYANIGRLDRAIDLLDDLKDCKDVQGNGAQLSFLAISLRKKGRFEEALHCWNRLLESPDPVARARIIANRAGVYAAMGNISAARDDFESAIRELEPQLPETAQDLAGISYSYACALAEFHDFDEAERAYRLHVYVSLQNALIPLGRPYSRDSTSKSKLESKRPWWKIW